MRHNSYNMCCMLHKEALHIFPSYVLIQVYVSELMEYVKTDNSSIYCGPNISRAVQILLLHKTDNSSIECSPNMLQDIAPSEDIAPS